MNQSIFLWLNSWAGQNPFFDLLAFFAARDLIFILLAGFLGFIWRQAATARPRLVVATLLCGLLAFQLATLIQVLVPVARPQATAEPVNILIAYANQQSLPSEHTLFAFLLAAIVFGRRRSLGLEYLAGATIIGLSRIVVGVHWPLDVLAGALIGIGFGWLATLLLDD